MSPPARAVPACCRQPLSAVWRAEDDHGMHAVVVTGAGEEFCGDAGRPKPG